MCDDPTVLKLRNGFYRNQLTAEHLYGVWELAANGGTWLQAGNASAANVTNARVRPLPLVAYRCVRTRSCMGSRIAGML